MKILLATDGSEAALSARQFLAALDPSGVEEVRVLTVISLPAAWMGTYIDSFYAGPETLSRIHEEEQAAAQQVAERERAALEEAGFTVRAETLVGDVPEVILSTASERNADLIAVGRGGVGGVSELVLGSVASNVIRHAEQPVLVGRAPRSGLQRVLVATDGSENAGRALGFAARLPLPAASRFTLLSVVKPYQPFPTMFGAGQAALAEPIEEIRQAQRQAAKALVDEAREHLVEAGRPVDPVVREGDPAAEIVAAAQEGDADLTVVGARGVSGLRGLLLGSVADRLLRQAEGSLLIVR